MAKSIDEKKEYELMKYIHEPIRVNQVNLHNRMVMPPMATAKTPDGKVTQDLVDYYDEKSKGGYLGLIITEHCYINPQGMAHKGQVSVATDDATEGLKAIADVIHKNGSKTFVQINHAGRSTSETVTGMPTLGPSVMANSRIPDEQCQAMTQEDINQVIADFAAAAKRVQGAGFDGVEIHSAHTYLLDQFYSPITNKRRDAYTGETLEGRLKLHGQVIEAVRAATGDDFAIALRLGGCDYMDGGATIEDSVEAAKMLEDWGIDLLDISGGMNGYTIKGYDEPGYFQEMTQRIKEAVSIPVILTGGVTKAKEAEALLEADKADMIGVGRAIFKDSQWVVRELGASH